MSLEVRLSATLRRRVPGYDPLRGLALAWRPGVDVSAVLSDLGLSRAEVKIIMVNGQAAGPERVLADGDRVGLFPAVGGG